MVGPIGNTEVLQVTDPSRGRHVLLGSEDITTLLRDVTDANSSISLRGCHSYRTALEMRTALDGATVTGSVTYMIGIPGTTWSIGDFE